MTHRILRTGFDVLNCGGFIFDGKGDPPMEDSRTFSCGGQTVCFLSVALQKAWCCCFGSNRLLSLLTKIRQLLQSRQFDKGKREKSACQQGESW